MQLDDLKQSWGAQGRGLERSLVIDERLLRKLRFAMVPYLSWRAIESLTSLAALLAVVSVLAEHVAEPRYLLVAGALAVFTAGLGWLSARLLVRGMRLDYDGPVTAIQRDIERLKLAEYRAFKWALLGGVLLWLPGPLVLFEALTGVDAIARVDLAWLAGNLVFGLAVLVLGQSWSRRHVERADLSPFARRVVDSLAGWSLRRATGHLAELSKFEQDGPTED